MSPAARDDLGQALARALRARAGSAPAFPAMLRAARLRASPGHSTGRTVVPAWRQVVLAGGVLAMAGALWLAWRGAGPVGGRETDAADAQLARDMALARQLSPERQWHVPTDALIAARGFHTPVIVEMPGIDNPFKESVL